MNSVSRVLIQNSVVLTLVCRQYSFKMSREPADNQLLDFKNSQKSVPVLTGSSGAPVDDKTNSATVGPLGPIVLQDFTLIDELAHFDRERIPERVVHAKGAGAFGYFEVTHDITKYCKASLFSNIGKRTPIAVRCSTVGGESGSADTVRNMFRVPFCTHPQPSSFCAFRMGTKTGRLRMGTKWYPKHVPNKERNILRDPRGFAVKFYTEEGIWDLVGNNTPIFFIKDPILFPSFIHTQKRNPATHLKDADMFWDFISLRPETTHQVMFLFSDRGIPDGHRHMNGYGSHTFKLVNSKGEPVYCKFHYKTNQGIKNLPVAKAADLSGSDPDYSIRDLYNAIAKGNFPSWTFYIQVMTFEQAEKFKWNPFDLTKVWPHGEYPLIPVGKLVLDRNPSNYFVDVEQIAFSPAHMVPGIEPSPDKMLQGRLFSYNDTHRHRLGANYLQLPVNCPYRTTIANSQRDGPACYGTNQGGSPNYFPNSFNGQKECPNAAVSKFKASGDVAKYNSNDGDNFGQCTLFWKKTLNEEERSRLIDNIVGSLKHAADFIQERAVKNFSQVDADFGRRLSDGLRKYDQASSKL